MLNIILILSPKGCLRTKTSFWFF